MDWCTQILSNPITLKFCTCHHSFAAVACATFRCDPIAEVSNTGNLILVPFRVRVLLAKCCSVSIKGNWIPFTGQGQHLNQCCLFTPPTKHKEIGCHGAAYLYHSGFLIWLPHTTPEYGASEAHTWMQLYEKFGHFCAGRHKLGVYTYWASVQKWSDIGPPWPNFHPSSVYRMT